MTDTKDTNVRRDSAPTEGSLPFFARFLEGQHSDDRVLQAAPERRMTLKYPSDRDDVWDRFLDS
jgi:hypothetical protein